MLNHMEPVCNSRVAVEGMSVYETGMGTGPETPAARLDRLLTRSVNDSRREYLLAAIDLGADDETLLTLASVGRIHRRSSTIVIPPGRYEGLSRGKGWCRLGRGSDVSWGERTDGGYLVGPGRWTVGSSDGFSRKKQEIWTVEHVKVGDEIWTVAT